MRKIQCQRHGVDEPAAEDGATDRAEQHRDAEDRHEAAHAGRARGLGHDRHAERHEQASTEALDDAEEDEHVDARRRGAEDRADGEEAEGEHVEALGAEAVGGPAGQRDDGGEGQRVGRDGPGDRGVRQRVVGAGERRLQLGSATLTTVMSRIDMMAPRTTTPAILRTAPSILSGYSVWAGLDKGGVSSSNGWGGRLHCRHAGKPARSIVLSAEPSTPLSCSVPGLLERARRAGHDPRPGGRGSRRCAPCAGVSGCRPP